jgi:hypothetical protein
VPLGLLGETLAHGFNRLGWHWWPSDSAIATRDYEGRAACINLGPCIMGCAQGAKGSTDVTYWPAAIRSGVELRTHCRVREITLDERGMADGVIYYDGEGASSARRPRSSCSRATGSARRACCSTRRRALSRTGSPTAAGSSART